MAAADRRLDLTANPRELLGKRIRVLWAHGKTFEGVVDDYNDKERLHHVTYEDGEKKWYNMRTKTFWVEGNEEPYRPEDFPASNTAAVPPRVSTTQGSTNPMYTSAYTTRVWTPYVSRFENANTPTTFHVMIDPRAVMEGDRVVIVGNLAEMSAWGEGIEMIPDPFNPMVFSVTIDMPFDMRDSNTYGMFQFRFDIISPTEGVISEGQNARMESRMRRQFYYNFRPNYRFNRFKGLSPLGSKQMFETFLQTELDHLRTSQITVTEFLPRYSDIVGCTSGCYRGYAEDVFDDFIKRHSDEALSPDFILVLLATVGQFGLTTQERVYTTGYGYTYSALGGVAAPSTVAYKTPIKPRPWCWFCVERLDVPALYHKKWQQVLGSNYMWAIRGLQEAVERLSEDTHFEWLLVSPLLAKFKIRPRVGTKKSRDAAEDFRQVADTICNLVRSQHDLVQAATKELEFADGQAEATGSAQLQVQVAAQATSEVTAAPSEDLIGLTSIGVNNDDDDELPAVVQLCRDWLSALVKYAPALADLAGLCETDLAIHAEQLLPAFTDKLEDIHWASGTDFDVLETIVNTVAVLKTPVIAAALLRNPSADSFKKRVIRFVALCIHDSRPRQVKKERGVTEMKGDDVSAADEVAEELQEDSAPKGLTKEWVDLSNAAKEWLHRIHGSEPMVEEKQTSGGGWTWYSSSKSNKPRKLTEQELLKQRHDCLRTAINDTAQFFQLWFFKNHPQGLLFELTRCWFFKGDFMQILEPLCNICAETEEFQRMEPGLADFVRERAARAFDESAASVDSAVRAMGCVVGSLHKDSEFAHSLLYRLLLRVTWPGRPLETLLTQHENAPLESVLANCDLWEDLFQWCPRGWSEHSPLAALLETTRVILTTVAESIRNDTVEVRDLKVVTNYTQRFLQLLQLLEINVVSAAMLRERQQVLMQFDQQLEHVQCFASFYCSCGVRMEASKVRETVEILHASYPHLQSNTLPTALDSVQALPHVRWLYQLRTSELFLELWRSTGRQLCIEAVQGAQEVVDTGDALAGVRALFADDAEEEKDEEEVVDPENDSEEAREARRLFVEARFARQDAVVQIKEQLENMVLSQDVVVHQLVPRVQRIWFLLAQDTFVGTLDIDRLGKTFGKLQSESQVEEELRLLAATSNFTDIVAQSQMSGHQLVENSLGCLKDYLLLRRLCKWLPGLLAIHELIQELCTTALEEDPFRTTLQQAIADINSGFEAQTLATVSALVANVRDIFTRYTAKQLDFLTTMATSAGLVNWLLEHSSTEEFNRLLQVVRPCTDEPRLLSCIASLVHVRTMLLQPLYSMPPYDGFADFLHAFQTVEFGITEAEDGIWHLNNVISSFDALMDVFEKQTRSPGIKSCYDLKEIRDRGTFVLRGSSNPDQVLVLEICSTVVSTEVPEEQDAGGGTTREEQMDYLLDLRSKLLMTEIPAELEEEMQASTMVEAFVAQLQILGDMRDAIVQLYQSGHIRYQDEYAARYPFDLDGLAVLQQDLQQLQTEAVQWKQTVKEARDKHYFLNFFTMREILQLRELVLQTAQAANSDAEASSETAQPSTAAAAVEEAPMTPEVEFMVASGFSKEWSVVALSRCGNNVDQAIDFCFSHQQHMDRIVAEERSTGRSAAAAQQGVSIWDEQPTASPSDKFLSMMHLVSSAVSEDAATRCMEMFKAECGADKPLLTALGTALGELFGTTASECAARTSSRRLPLPGSKAANRADMLVLVDDGTEKRLPIFVTAAEDPALVIDTVLSVYVRRGRLPEPGEILFCTAETTIEELELLLHRFVAAKSHGRGEFVFCIADLHNLSYTQQCTLVERLRAFLQEYGTDDAATLLMVSGYARQVALNSLSSQAVDIPPLSPPDLRAACEHAFRVHCGETECVASVINGGGKTHRIMTRVGERQASGEPIIYRRVPIREATNPQKLVELLAAIPRIPGDRAAIHLDIGHIIPAAANTMLFQLLLIGVLRDPNNCAVYHRENDDIFMVEVPNSLNNKTAIALRLCTLLPTTILCVDADQMDFRKPTFIDAECSQIRLLEYTELMVVCKWLHAFLNNVFTHGSDTLNADFSPYTAEDLSPAECFTILKDQCCHDGGPSPRMSWSIVNAFVTFMYRQFSMLEEYPLLQGAVLAGSQGLENFKEVFLRLLVETSRDFALRSVPQAPCVGPERDAADIADGKRATDGLPAEGAVDAGDDGDGPPDGPSLGRQSSSVSLQEAAHRAGVAAPPSLVRQNSAELARRFQAMLSWEQSDHPVVVFKTDAIMGGVSGVDILSLNPQYLAQYIDGPMKAALEQNFIDLGRDWTTITNEEGVAILRGVEGLYEHQRGGVHALEPGYVLTVDNLLKMLSIQLRLRFNLPVIIMGETGCGKSTLMRNLCAILGAPLHTLNVHGGMDDRDILAWMTERVALARRMTDPTERLVVFFDEINTCNSMGLFKEMVCDRSMNGRRLPENIKIIAACNPYRLRTTKSLYGGEEMAGLVFEHYARNDLENVGTGIKDPLRNLVYRVHPLPESMIDYIFDFGALSSETEELYIKAMLRKQIGMYAPDDDEDPGIRVRGGGTAERDATLQQTLRSTTRMTPFQEFVEVFAQLICAAQECIRTLSDGERSAASLRDVARCVRVFRWFGEHFAQVDGPAEGWDLADFFCIRPKAQRSIRKALILSLAYCYHARLPREERRELIMTVTNAWRSLQVTQTSLFPTMNYFAGGGMGAGLLQSYNRQTPKCRWLQLDPNAFVSVLDETQRDFVRHMNLGDGIALNEALCENLFMIMVSILNDIPIFVIGKPGSSKSLAMNLIQSNLNGDASDNDFLKSLPAVEVFSYQCSPLSTSAGIEQAFHSARRYKREAQNTVVVVLLDEVGLAEQSPHLPLKVLHKTLDEGGPGEAVVGISNWALDPAKMNRAVHLYRPAPTVEDLSMTAEGMVRSANLKGYLQSLALAYNDIYHEQEHPDFWGLREFYSTVRAINAALNRLLEAEGPDKVTVDAAMLLNAVLRNYGGRPQELQRVAHTFFARLGLTIPLDLLRKTRVEDLIRQNTSESEARHLMLLTRNNAALSLLFDRGILNLNTTEIIFGSDFPLDQTDLQICLNIQRVKLCMAEGITVVLVHCESLYESLYDLLNQHYCEYGGQMYVRLAFGTHSRLCPIHRAFRVIVVVEKVEAYTRLAPPLLNRFEKQVFERKDVLEPGSESLMKQLARFVSAFASCGQSGMDHSFLLEEDVTRAKQQSQRPRRGATLNQLRAAFCGFHTDLLSSLVASLEENFRQTNEDGSGHGTVNYDDMLSTCVKKLLWIASPEATCRLLSADGGKVCTDISREFGVDIAACYFKEQRHSSLPAFAQTTLDAATEEHGTQVVVMTYSPLSQDVVNVLAGGSSSSKHISHIVLHELDQERDLRTKVTSFFQDAHPNSVLLVQCDPLAASRRRIEHAKFIIDNARAKYVKDFDQHQRAAVHSKRPMEIEARQPGSEQKVDVEGAVEVMPDARHWSDRLPDSEHPADVPLNDQQPEPSAPKLHVVMLIHLPRGSDDGDARYSVDFDTRWHYAFVDSVLPADAAGLPDVESMIGRSMKDVVLGLDLKKVLVKSFRHSLSRLVYRYERTNEDVRHQIESILRCLDEQQFLAAIHAVLHDLLSHHAAGVNIDVVAQQQRALQLAGTFQAALHTQILEVVSTMFSTILAHMDRNNGLRLFLQPELQQLWLYLFTMSFRDLNVSALGLSAGVMTSGRARKQKTVVEVQSDGVGDVAFDHQFPFSFYLTRILDSMRAVAEHREEAQLIHQLELVGLDHGIAGRVSQAQMEAYIYDFTCMYCIPVRDISRREQARVLHRLLVNVGGGAAKLHTSVTLRHDDIDVGFDEKQGEDMNFDGATATPSSSATTSPIERSGDGEAKFDEVPVCLEYLAQVHYRYWSAERILQLYFELLNIVPGGKRTVWEYLMQSESVDDSTHVAVLNLVLDALQTRASNMRHVSEYPDWLVEVSSAKTPVFSLLDVVSADTAKASLRTRWIRLEFFCTYTREVAIPLQLEPAVVHNLVAKMGDLDFTTQAAFQTVVDDLVTLQKQILRQQRGIPDEFICPITLERMTDPVIASDGHTYERSGIEEWLATGHRTSPRTNLPLRNLELRPDPKLRARLEEYSECDLSKFLEYFISDVVCKLAETSELQSELLRALVLITAGRLPVAAAESRYSVDVLPSAAARLGLLRELMRLNESGQAAVIAEALGHELVQSVGSFGFLDTPMCVSYMTVLQESLPDVPDVAAIDTRLLRQNTWSAVEVKAVLACVASIRQALAALAKDICIALDRDNVDYSKVEQQAALERAHELSRRVEPLLADTASGHEGVVRSMRMFLLKQIERLRGLTFLRMVLTQAPLCDAMWVQQWKAAADSGLVRFLGSNRLPRVNPLLATPFFTHMKEALAAFLSTSNITLVQDAVASCLQEHGPEATQASLLLGLFNEVYLLAVLQQQGTDAISVRCRQLHEWLQTSQDLSFCSAAERTLLLLFAGANVPLPQPLQDVFKLDHASSPEAVMRVRFIAHVCAASLAAPSHSPLRFFRTLMLQPSATKDNYFPTMPEDMTKMAQEVMGGRWYTCRNGHPFYVDLCGRPTVIQKCAECGVDIGGENHDLLADNVDLGNVGTEYYKTTVLDDKTDRNYCMRGPAEEAEDRFFSVRELNPTAVRVIRLVMHAAMLAGCAVGGNTWRQQAETLVHRAYANPANLPAFFQQHFLSDWGLLRALMNRTVDDVVLVLHLILLSVGGSSHGDDMPIWPENLQQSGRDGRDLSQLQTVDGRKLFEEVFARVHINRYANVDNLNEVLVTASSRLTEGEGDVGGAFTAELLEAFDVTALSTQQRAETMPALWRYRRQFTLEHFISSLNMTPAVAEAHPVLHAFFNREQQLHALRHLPAVLEWNKLVLARFNNKLDRDRARELTIGDLLDDLPEQDKPRWREAFDGFAKAWNESWKSLQRFGCLVIPAEFRSIVMGPDVPISFCLVGEQDEGICALALIRFLAEQHNEFVQLVDESLLLRDRSGHQRAARATAISSRHMSNAHSIRYELQHELHPYLEKQCVKLSAGGDVEYDFAKAEAFIIDRYFVGIPALDLELRMFLFAHEQRPGSGMAALRQKVLQAPLPTDLEEAIRRDISTPALAQSVLDVLETAVSLLCATGGSFVRQLDDSVAGMPLGRYLKTVLLLDDAVASRAISGQVLLMHLESLWNLLVELTSCDIFAKISFKYRQPLDDETKSVLLQMLDILELDDLLPLLRGFIVEHLHEEHIDPKSCLKDNLAWLELGDSYLMDLDWFQNGLPSFVQMGNAVEVYELLHASQQA